MTSSLERSSNSDREEDEDNEHESSDAESNEYESGSSESDFDGNDGPSGNESELGAVSDDLFFLIGNRSKYGRPMRLNSKFL